MRDRWKHVKEIFSAAVATPPHKRGRLIADHCNGDEALLREVEELILAHEGAGDFLEQEIASVHDLPVNDVPEEQTPGDDFSGRKLGAYRLERPVGEGGMGFVYLARRDDDLFEKRVAVKIIRRYHDERRLERFRKEREILARLTHPNIAQLIDGGVTEDGLPYLVMEYVDGLPIDQFCTDGDLGLRDRLRLFEKVFRAVQYAHQSLVVHRDLKPSNILVTRDGEPKLLDFGIAKLLEDEGATVAAPATVTVARWMTPEYASPEQVRGEPITTASDVYSLGVILYRILTGQSPYDLSSRPIYEIERIISEEEPSKPSTVATEDSSDGTGLRGNSTRTVRLRRGLKGDLDNIILMALRKEASRRYASVEQFGEDIERYLGGLPVRAQSDTLRYRAKKFVQRHTVGVGTAILFVMFALGAFGFILRESNEARHQRDTANEMLQFAVSLFEVSADPEFAQDTTVTAREMLDAGLREAREQLSGRPDHLSRVLNLLGELYQKLGIYGSAEEVHRQALAMAAENGGGLRLADGYFGLGRSMSAQGRFEQAERLLEDALILRLDYLPADAPEIADVLHEMAQLSIDKGEVATADSLIDEAIRINTKAFGSESEHVARSMRVKADGLRIRGELEESASMFQDALEIQKYSIGLDHLQVGFTLNSLGIVYRRMGEFGKAEELLLRALEIKRIRLGQHHPSVASTLNNLSIVKQEQGELPAALELFKEALSIEIEHLGSSNLEVAKTKHNLAVLLRQMGDLKGADEYYREAIDVLEETLPESHPDIAVSKHDYAILLRNMGDEVQSSRYYSEAAAVYRANLPHYAERLSNALNGLGKNFANLGRHQDAVDAFFECLSIRERVLEDGHWRLGTAHSYLGESLADVGNHEEAELHLRIGLAILRTALGDEDAKTQDAEERLARFIKSSVDLASG